MEALNIALEIVPSPVIMEAESDHFGRLNSSSTALFCTSTVMGERVISFFAFPWWVWISRLQHPRHWSRFGWRWAICGKPSVIPKEGQMGEEFIWRKYSLMEKNWCCCEFWFQLYQLFPSSFVTLGIHTWIVWEPTYETRIGAKPIRLGTNFQNGNWVTAHMVLFGSTVISHGLRGKSMKIHHRNRWADGFPIETLWISKEFRDFPRFHMIS